MEHLSAKRRNDLPCVDEVLWVECLLDAVHHLDGGVVKLVPQQLHLAPADAVLAGAGAAQPDGVLGDLLRHREDAVHLRGVRLVVGDHRVEVAIAHVAKGEA